MTKKIVVTIKDRMYEISPAANGGVSIDGKVVDVDLVEMGGGAFSLRIDGRQYHGYVRTERMSTRGEPNDSDTRTIVAIGDQEYAATVDDEVTLLRKSLRGAREAGTGSLLINAPMPGLVVKIDVAPEDHVKPGQPLLVLEAMKMENEIRTHEGGVVQTVHVTAGSAVEKGVPLITIVRE